MAVIALGVEFGILDIVVNVLYHVLHCVEILFHIGNFYIRNRAAGRYLLELAFEGELCKRVDILAHVHVIAVGIIALVRNILDCAVFFLVYAGEAVAKALRGRAVKTEAQARFLLPLLAVLAQGLHNFERELAPFLSGVGNALYKFCNLVQTDIPQRYCGIAVHKVFVYFFTLFQPRYCAVLPMHGRNVGKRAHKRVVAAHKRVVAKL